VLLECLKGLSGEFSKRTFEKNPEPAGTGGVAELAQRLGLDLTDALASNGKDLADFFESVLAAAIETETHLDDAFFARSKRAEHVSHLLFQVEADGGVRRRGHTFIFDEIAEMGFLVLANGSLEGDGLLGNFFGFANGVDGDIHSLGDFFGGRFAAQFLDKKLAGADLFVDGLDHVNRDTDGASLVSDGAGDGLANPPSRVSGKLVAAAPLEFVGAFHEADVAFLNEVEKLEAAVAIFFGDGDNQTEIGLGEFFFGLIGFGFAAVDQGESALETCGANNGGVVELFAFGAAETKLFASSSGIATRSGSAALEADDLAIQSVEAFGGVTGDVDEPFFSRVP